MNSKDVRFEKLSDVPEAVWQKLSTQVIYFGHQSVGFNILDGVRALQKENPQIKLALQETYDPADFKRGTLSHSRIGYNYFPQSKMDIFAFFAKVGAAAKTDIMLFKFCYVDINTQTDTETLFKEYQNTYAKLKKQYPETTFIHATVPLTIIQQGAKAWVKEKIGRPLGGSRENQKRHAFNEMLRSEYAGKAPLFDIAAVESTFPDGTRAAFETNGQKAYYLVPEYTYDGSHLNADGSKRVAEQLLLTILGAI